MGRLSGRVALVTGASRGIGRAVAKRFAAEGAEVICVARTQGALEELDDEIAASGGKAVLAPQDLTDFEAIDRMAAGVAQRYGRLDILVGNAGEIGGGLAPVGHLEPKQFAKAFDVKWDTKQFYPSIADPHGTFAFHYGVTSPPSTFIIDTHGRVVAELLGPVTTAQLNAVVARVRA